MSIKNYSNKQKMLLILIIVIIVILIMIIIRNINLNNNNNNNENIQYNSNSLIFKSNNTSESTSDNEVGSESENLNNELENQRYLDSGLVSEFTSIDFIHISINKTNIDKYYRKITDYLEQNNTLALISILDDIVINNENINEGNVIEYYEKNGFTKDFNILDITS